MKVRTKVVLIISLVIICMLLLLYHVNKEVLLDGFAQLEEKIMRQNIERGLSALQVEMYNLQQVNHNLSGFVTGESNFEQGWVADTFRTLEIDFVFLVDDSGQIITGHGFESKTSDEITSLSEDMQRHIGKKDVWQNGRECISGIVILTEGAALVNACTVSCNNQEEAGGSLIIGRFLDQETIEQLSAVTNLSIDIFSFTGERIQDDVVANLKYKPSKTTYYIKPLSNDVIAGYVMIRDIYGEPGVVLQVQTPRTVYLQGQSAQIYILSSFLIAGFIFGAMVLFILEKTVLSRLAYLSDSVSAIGSSGDFSSRITMPGNDECKTLADSINGMLAALEKSQSDLRDSEERFRLLAENARDVVYRLRLVPGFAFEYISPALYDLTGYTPEECYADAGIIYKLVHPQEHYIVNSLIFQKTIEHDPEKVFTMQCVHKNGRLIWIEQSVVPIYDEDNNLVAIEAIARDVTKRKELEDQLKYCSWHDALTGLYNRAYFDMEMHRLQKGREPLGLIICDVDGLKLVNDTLGHDTGDKLLQLTARVIKDSLRREDIVCRLGGDEFGVLLPDCDENIAEDICRRIREAVANHNAADPGLPLSISVGFAVDDKKPAVSRDIYKEADNNMYREKVQNRQNARNVIVKALMKELEAKDYVSERHTGCLQDLAVEMAEYIGLPEDSIAKLRLLAKFQDIGLVGVPDNIMLKPGPLTSEETVQMQQHCENGHRIALAVPDLEPIADLILKHHEWYNGEGYPLGLKGEEIPLACRILAIVDTYNAMTCGRSYRKPVSSEEALAELQRCAGTQFDPRLVAKFVEMITNKQACGSG